MKKIFYNNKLKKLLTSLCLVVLLFSYVVPLKGYAASTAENFKTLMENISYNYGIYVSDKLSDYNSFINNLKSLNSNNYVTSSGSGNNITITIGIAGKDDSETDFVNIFRTIVNNDENVARNCFVGVYSGLNVINVEPQTQKPEEEEPEKEEPKEEPTSPGNQGSRNTTAQELWDVIAKLAYDKIGLDYPQMNTTPYQKIINWIKEANTNNSVKSEGTGDNIIITITATTTNAVYEAFRNGGGFSGGSADGWASKITTNDCAPAKTGLSYGIRFVDKGYDSEVDDLGLTGRDEAVYRYLRDHFLIDSETALKMINDKDENGEYKYMFVTWDGETVGKIDIDTNHYTEEFFSPEAWAIIHQEEIANETSDKDEGDLGGWLLEPIFMLVNFVFDSLTDILGYVMTGEDGLSRDGATGKEPTIDTSGLTYKDVIRVNTAPFGVINHFTINYTPEKIFSGEIELLSIDFISGNKSDGTAITNTAWTNIRNVISQWYKVLRMIAIIGLLSVLIYTGIKIIISANAKDKAKYKEWIINWFIAVAILFSMHYIMAFITSVTGEVSKLLNEANEKIIVEEVENEAAVHAEDDVNQDNLFETNLMGLVRFRIQGDNMDEKIAYEVMYIALFIYTVKFTFVYLKRVLNMAFLTLIAPIVALTYPIDKLNDGNAQGFNMWLKEYIFNALLQPMHLLMYYILVGSAVTVAASNPLYGIVVLMFMSEAEKLLKKIFGFEKAGATSTTASGGMAGAFAAGALASGVKNIAKMAGKGSGGNGDKMPSGGDKNPALDAPKPTEKDSDMNAFLDGPGNEGNEENDTPQSDEGSSGENSLEEERENVASERGVLDEFEAEGATSDNWKDGDYEAYQELEREQLEREAALAEREKAEEAGNAEQGNPESEGDSASAPASDTAQEQQPQPSTDNIHEIAERRDEEHEKNKEKKKGQSKFAKGAKAVGKRLLKPVWDLDHKGKQGALYNSKRLVRKVGKAALGVGVGITAAAVQAGISITDGKYSIGEGIATLGAGYVGGGAIFNKVDKGVGGLVDTYRAGATAGDTKAQMARAQKRFADREDVIEFNKKQYPGQEQERMKRQRDNYLPQGVHDLKDMKSCMKYADKLKEKGMTEEQADRRAAATLDFKNRLKEQGQSAAIYDQKKRDKYIETMVAKAEADARAKNKEISQKELDKVKLQTKTKYNNAFNSIIQYDDANS